MADLTVLGIWDGHDAGVALVHQGALIFALSEERVCRKKRASGFPFLSLQACLDASPIDPREIDVVAMPGRYGRLLHRAGDPLYRRTDSNRDPMSFSSVVMRELEVGLSRIPGLRALEFRGSRALVSKRLRSFGIEAPIVGIDHHDAHAWTARLGGLSDPMVVTMDGYGDGLAATFDGPGEARESFRSPASSVALVYGAVTRHLGYGEGDEGKVMGLAAHGNPTALNPWFRDVIGFEACKPSLGGRIGRRALETHRPEDVAAALQRRTEEVVCGWIQARLGDRCQLAVSGGLFANATLNGRLQSMVDELFVFPHMGDGGLCVGAAAAVAGVVPFDMPYLGPEYDSQRSEKACRAKGLIPERVEKPEQELLASITDGGGAARCGGRSEFGLRALGHRSILCRADDEHLLKRLGQRLDRDPVMPFAPIRRSGEGSKTMTVVVEADDVLQSQCPAAVHVDGTARTQVLDHGDDPALWQMLGAAEERGMPALINTSFNRHGEPIVESPEDAVETFLAAGLDIMQLGPWIVRRPQ